MAEFGVTPLNFGEFSRAEIDGFVTTIDRRNRAARQQARTSRRRR